MSLVCKTLVLIEDEPTLEVVRAAFRQPKYELHFVSSLDEATSCILALRMDLFIVDARMQKEERIKSIVDKLPTLIIEADHVQKCHGLDTSGDEVNKIRMAAGRLLRKNYFDWILDALEYTS
ncbi:MAG TPA: hypothetical protein VIS48_16520 [Candidatus Kryptonia bacterium]